MKKEEPKGRLTSQVAVTGGVLIAATVFLLYAPWPPLFDVREVAVSGNVHVPTESAIRISGFRLGDHLIRLPTRRAARALSSLTWVKHASIRRSYFHRVEIALVERVPVATLPDPAKGKGEWVVGEDGLLIQQTAANLRPPLVLRGALVKGQAAPGVRLTDRRVIALLGALLRHRLTEGTFTVADFSDPTSVVLQGADELTVLLGPVEGLEPRIDELGALFSALDVTQYRSIDLRFGGEATLVPRKVVKR